MLRSLAPAAASPLDGAPVRSATPPTAASPTAASPTAASPTAASPTAASPTAASPTAASPLRDQLARSVLPLLFACVGAVVYAAYLAGRLPLDVGDWLARALLACFTLPGVMQGAAAVRGVRARLWPADDAPAPGWLRIAGQAVRAAGGVLLACTLVALPPHTALYLGPSAVALTLGETAWSLTEARGAWRGLRAAGHGAGLLRLVAVAVVVLLGAASALVGARLAAAPTAAASVALRARELPVRATLETAVASARDTRRRQTAGFGAQDAALAPYPFDTVGLAADLGRRPAAGVRLAYWTVPGGGVLATAQRADGTAKCAVLLVPGMPRELWCTSDDVASTSIFVSLLRPDATVPRRAWRWVAPG